MEEKIKIMLPLKIYRILLKDMELFEFNKANGEFNQNLFYTTLIKNYYTQYAEDITNTTQIISTYLSFNNLLSSENISLVASEITSKLLDISYPTQTKEIMKSVAVKPTKFSKHAFDYINQFMLRNISISAFYRGLFTSYTSLSMDLREQIMFHDHYACLYSAINEKKKVYFTTKTDGKFEVSPYNLTASNEELFNYLIGVNKKGIVYSFRLSRILNVIKLDQPVDFNLDNTELMQRMIEVGPQYNLRELENEQALVNLTEAGQKMFNSSYVNRPKPIKIDGLQYTFNCSYQQLYQYFRRFGHHADVISPRKVRDQLKDFYKMGYHHYK